MDELGDGAIPITKINKINVSLHEPDSPHLCSNYRFVVACLAFEVMPPALDSEPFDFDEMKQCLPVR